MRKVEPDQIGALPVQIVEEGTFACTPEELFASFERDEDWKEWVGIDVERTTEGPYRPGFTRTVRTTTIRLDEVFTIWSAPDEIAFYVEGSSNPFLTAFAERYTVTATESGCRLRWQIGFEFSRIAGLVAAPVMKAALTRMARQGFPKLEAAAQRGAQRQTVGE